MRTVQPGAVDAPFFARLKSMGDQFFMDAVLHHAVRGDMDAVHAALMAIDAKDYQGLLWATSRTETVAISATATGAVKEASLLQAVCIALTAEPLGDVPLKRENLEMIDFVLETGHPERRCLMKRGWTDQRRILLDQAVDLCRVQQKSVKPRMSEVLPSERLFHALATRVPFDEALSSVMDGFAPEMLLRPHLRGVPRTLLQQGRVEMVDSLLSRLPEPGDENPHESLSITLQSMSWPLDDGFFNGLFRRAIVERKAASEATGMTFQGGSLLPQELALIQLLDRLECRVPDHACAVGIRMVGAALDACFEKKLPISEPLVRALISRIDRITDTTAADPWPFDTSTARIHGVDDDRIAGHLLQLALKHHLPAIVAKLRPLLERDPSVYRVKTTWAEIEPERVVDLEAFRDTLSAVRDAGFDIAAVFDDPNKTRTPGGARPTSSVLHDLAASGHPQAIGMMLATLELGTNPHAKDHREWKAKSRLPSEQRAPWEGIVRSFEARNATMNVLEGLVDGSSLEPSLTKTTSRAKP